MKKCALILVVLTAIFHGKVKSDSYLNALTETKNLNKNPQNNNNNVRRDGYSYSAPVPDNQNQNIQNQYGAPVYSQPPQNYGPPVEYHPKPIYGPPQPIYGPPQYIYPVSSMVHPQKFTNFQGVPYSFLESLFDKFKFKLDLFTVGKILLKLVIFKKFVSFFAILCLLLFVPTLKNKNMMQMPAMQLDEEDDFRSFTNYEKIIMKKF